MALMLSSNAQTVFFSKVFGPHHSVTSQAKALVTAGVTFEVSLYSVSAYLDGGKTQLGSTYLSVGSTSLMKGTVAEHIAESNRQTIAVWVNELVDKVPAEKFLTATQPTPPQPVAVPVSFEMPKPKPAVIHLKDAEALGQKVHGTSNGSVYHCIALSESGVKLAARLYQGGSISIRAEWTGTPQTDLQKLQDVGMQMKSGYGSMHFASEGVPVQKVIGAFLFGAGIEWKALVSGSQLVITDKAVA